MGCDFLHRLGIRDPIAQRRLRPFVGRIEIENLAIGSGGESTLTGFWRPGTITITGGISSVDVPAFDRAWTINVLAAQLNYDPNNAYSMKLRIKDLLGTYRPVDDTFAFGSRPFLEKPGPFTALQRFFNRYRPHGQIDIDLDTSGTLNRLLESTLRGKVYCKDVSICDRKFPYFVEHLIGRIGLTE